MSKKDYYQILGIPKSSTDSEIKKAYRKLAVKHHPDKNPGDKKSEEMFKEISEAYQILSDKEKRNLYDSYGHDGLSGQRTKWGQEYDINDFFNSFRHSGFDDIFGRQSNRGNTRKGANLRVEIGIKTEDIVNGVKKKIAINRDIKCDSCGGNGSKNGSKSESCFTCSGSGRVIQQQRTPIGFIRQEHACGSCNGTGKIIRDKCNSCFGMGIKKNQREEIEVNIPRGARGGMEFAIRNKGNEPAYGGVCGDLLVNVFQKKEDRYFFEGANVICDLHINIIDAMSGVKNKEINTPHGKVNINIPKNCYQGKALRLSGRGLPTYNSTQVGDMIVYINFDIPDDLIDKIKKIDKNLYSNIKNKEIKSDKKGIYRMFREHFTG